jgi:hypothetical protein
MNLAAYRKRMLPALQSELARIRTDIAAEAHRLEVCERGRDPMFPARLVPVLRARIAKLFEAQSEISHRIDLLTPNGPYSWLDAPATPNEERDQL